jgi:hypothetical protein
MNDKLKGFFEPETPKPFRFFESEIFYGASNREGTGQTEQDMEELQRQIAEVQSINSGLQQPSHYESKSAALIGKQHEEELFRLKIKLGESIKAALGI